MARVARAFFLLTIALAGCLGGSEAQTIPRSSGPGLVLQPEDLAAVFSQFDGGRQVRADFPPGPREDPARFGRLDGWKARYRRGGDVKTEGPLVVESRVDLFDESDGAKQDLDAYRAELERAVAQSAGTGRMLDVAGLGEAALGYTLRQPGSPDLRYFTVAWRDRNATASVAVSGFDGKVTLAQALALARKQERRIGAVPG